MNFRQLKEKSEPHFYCLSLDKFFPKILRGFLRKGSALAALTAFAMTFFDSLPLSFGKIDGLFFLFIFIYLLLSFLEFFYRSMSHEGLRVRISESLINGRAVDYSLSSVLFSTDEIDASRALLETRVGAKIFLRCGILPQNLKDFRYSERTSVMASILNFESDYVGLPDYAAAIFEADKSLQSFLSRNSVNKDEFIGAANWVAKMEDKERRRSRFWSRENLGAIPSMGTSWSYGISFDLGKFGAPFGATDISVIDIENKYREKEVLALENILEKREEANAIIIDDEEAVARDIVGRLIKRMELGIAPPTIEHKNVIELDWNALVASFKNRSELEAELLKILNQSITAGNIVIYIRDISSFASSVKSLGINLPSLLAPYLSSKNLQIVTSVTSTDFHFFIETNPAILEKFERIIPDKAGAEATISALLEKAPGLENQYGLLFSFPSILAIANSADRFVTYGEMPNKAIDMLVEMAPWADSRKISVVKESDVSIFVSEKTGIAMGDILEKEAQKIARLEELLHKRVVGQNEAVKGIADAIRRSRSGISNPKRPLSSFLFVGPTGVGKTEVSKALAESFFGDENKMIRLDMSEYNGPEALSRLIGDFALDKSGILANKVRDNPYSVLLLDEFEKASPDVLDLFLQILDEGVFTDSLGKQVGCRNLIIIATSNAGSSLIWETIRSGKNLAGSRDLIINSIIRDKIFKPELLNRFDGIIFFHPLQKSELESVARIGLQNLATRLLKDKNIELVINSEIVNFLVEKGGDPEFGGRSINRAIKNEIENLIARKIISGEAKAGSKIEIRKEELL